MNINKQNRGKVVQRVQSLIAMSQDTSSPNEAAIALKRANKLMQSHDITSTELGSTVAGYGSSEYSIISSKDKTWTSIVALSVARLNNCIVKIKRGRARAVKKTYVFNGSKTNTSTCVFMMSYLAGSVGSAYNQDRIAYGLSELSDKSNYLLGFAKGIVGRITELPSRTQGDTGTQNDLSAYLEDSSKQSEGFYFDILIQKAPSAEVGCASYLGELAAKEVYLGRFMTPNHETFAAIT